jgi:hypothetical protein
MTLDYTGAHDDREPLRGEVDEERLLEATQDAAYAKMQELGLGSVRVNSNRIGWAVLEAIRPHLAPVASVDDLIAEIKERAWAAPNYNGEYSAVYMDDVDEIVHRWAAQPPKKD